MNSTEAIAIFDIGKTNKKLFVFDEQYNILLEKSTRISESTDEDGDACENLDALTQWVIEAIDHLMEIENVRIGAINFSTYGASFVHISQSGKPVAPLYNYLKPFPGYLRESFYSKYGGELYFSMQTASPILGNLNSGLQLYYLKKEKPEIFEAIHTSLHLPQYMSRLVTARSCSDITSIGCHTALWNFSANNYHEWVYSEGIADKLAPVLPSDQLLDASWKGRALRCGTGLHDSSAALIPYLAGFEEPFILVSTGTWCISLNPFNQEPLSAEELQADCLCYMEYRGKPIKASRLFAGYEHEQEVERLAAYFNVSADHYREIAFDPAVARRLADAGGEKEKTAEKNMLQLSVFQKRSLSGFDQYSDAYHQLMLDLMVLQTASIKQVAGSSSIKKIFVDGGFGKNPVYMSLLAAAFPRTAVYAASVAQASALGAALAVHHLWNKNNYPANLIELKLYADIEAIEI